jgi:hypothetical protein
MWARLPAKLKHGLRNTKAASEVTTLRVFRSGRATAFKLRYDLFEGLPYFTEKDTAEKAEGVLADVIEVQLRARVECDSLRERKRSRT